MYSLGELFSFLIILMIEIEILGMENISNEIQIKFFENFSQRLNDLQNNNINESISNSLISTIYDKPTDCFKDKYKRIKKEEEDIECNICFEHFKENEYKRDIVCGHHFHKKCIDKWINKYNKFSCPTCRCNIFSKVLQDISFQNLHL